LACLFGGDAWIVKEGEAEAKAFKEFFEWCDDASKNINYAIPGFALISQHEPLISW